MGKNELNFSGKQSDGKKPVNIVVVLLAFLIGAATACAAVWRFFASKGGKRTGQPERKAAAGNTDTAQTNKELRALVEELRTENERRKTEREEAALAQKVKAYKPRRHVPVKKIFARATAVVASAALIVTGLYLAPIDRTPVSTVQARESFGGIGQVVEEHNEDNPFVILDIVPGKAEKDGHDFSLGTIGYLAPGQSPIQQDLARIYGENKEKFYAYADRINLADALMGNGSYDLTYQEAYGGTGEDIKTSAWSKIFDPVEAAQVSAGKYPTGRLYAYVQEGKGPGFDYESEGDWIAASASLMSEASLEGLYSFAEGAGDYHVIFEASESALSGYRVDKVVSGNAAVFGGSYSVTTAVYRVEGGKYVYAGTIGDYPETMASEPDPKSDSESDQKPAPPVETDTGNQDSEQTPDPVPPAETDPGNQDSEQTPDPVPPAETDPGNQGSEQTPDPAPTDGTDPGNQDSEQTPDPAPPAESVATSEPTPDLQVRSAGGWRLLVNVEGEPPAVTTPEPETTAPETPTTPEPETTAPETPTTPEPAATTPGSVQPSEPVVSGMPAEGTYCVLRFTYVEVEQEEPLYQIRDVEPVSTEADAPCPYDSYTLEESMLLNSLNAVAQIDALAANTAMAGTFVYVGPGKGRYKLTRDRSTENTVAMTGIMPVDGTMIDNTVIDDTALDDALQDGLDVDAQSVSLQADTSYYVEVKNAPVYIRCTGGNDGLRRYVFNSLKAQDNASDDFAIRVNTVLAGDVTYEMVQEADLVYLEDGKGLYLDNVTKKYINAADVPDISDMAIAALLEEAVDSSKPVIVDYGIIEDTDNYAESKYQKLAKAFLKKDLLAFYNAMAKSGNLAANVLMNMESKEFPDKTDNNYHYVNRNVYVVSGTPLVGEDFAAAMDETAAASGFTEVRAAIRAENVMLPEDNKISDKISKAMAVQYIINYSLGMVGEYKDLSILELQPTANRKSDLHRDANDAKKSVVLYWQREDRDGGGQQILRSSRLIDTNVTVSSVAAFNSNYQDINTDYNMIFIGLDGQRFYHEQDGDGLLQAAYNDGDLFGKVYHTGDRVAGSSDGRYDANDITEQKKEALLDYLRAGYPIVVENDCFKGRSAQTASEADINTKYIASDTQMYAFLKEAVSMGGSEEDGIGIYTIEDVHSSALFAMQLNAMRPKVELRGTEENDTAVEGADMIPAEKVQDVAGIRRGTFEYRIFSDRPGEDKTYGGNLDRHLYLDLDYDGIYTPEEEIFGYQHEAADDGGRISVDFNEINFGIIPWKLEVTDANNGYRRASMEGCFTVSEGEKAKIKVLQILDDPKNTDANFQEQYEKVEDSMLAHYLRGAEAQLSMNWKIETVTPAVLAERLSKNENYLSLWDVVVMGFGDSKKPGDAVSAAVDAFIHAGGSVLISSAGASRDTDRLGLSTAVLGQKEELTYGRLGLHSNSKYRYEGIDSTMFYQKSGMLVDRINDGAITRWPYRIEETADLSTTEVSMPDYLLDIGTIRARGQTYATPWFTLIDGDYDGGYSVSPGDGENNYYLYSMGNVVYVGQSIYPYKYDPKTGETPEGAGIDECRIFVNALMAAYNAGLHRADVSIVAGFNGVVKVESVTIPFDVAFKESGEAQGGILGETVDVYFRFTDNNIAVDKVTEPSFYYRNAGVAADVELMRQDGTWNDTDYTAFASPVWAVENNRLVEVTDVGIVPGKVYRIKAPLAALQSGDDETSQICVVLTSRYTRAGENMETVSMDSVTLNRAQMFLLE